MDQNDRIRARAHEIWQAEGRPQGREADHWAQAERELAGEAEAAPEPAEADKSAPTIVEGNHHATDDADREPDDGTAGAAQDKAPQGKRPVLVGLPPQD